MIYKPVSDATTRHYSSSRSHGSPKIKITGTTPPAICDTYNLDDSLLRQYSPTALLKTNINLTCNNLIFIVRLFRYLTASSGTSRES